MPADGSMASAVADMLAAVEHKPEDAALVCLVERYAQAIDEAAEIADQAALIEPEDEDQAKRLQALSRRVEQQSVLAELGPRFQAALESLGASPKSRAAMLGKAGGSGDGRGGSKLDELRARRARQRDTEAVDPAAP